MSLEAGVSSLSLEVQLVYEVAKSRGRSVQLVFRPNCLCVANTHQFSGWPAFNFFFHSIHMSPASLLLEQSLRDEKPGEKCPKVSVC